MLCPFFSARGIVTVWSNLVRQLKHPAASVTIKLLPRALGASACDVGTIE